MKDARQIGYSLRTELGPEENTFGEQTPAPRNAEGVVTLASLPVLDVYVAFNPLASSATLLTAQQQALPASQTSNSYWTDVADGSNILSFTTNSGRQHYLDRVEAGTLSMVVNNRNGFFTNGQ